MLHDLSSRKLAARIGQVPGVIDGYLRLCSLLNRPPVFDSGWRCLPSWLSALDALSVVQTNRRSRRILVFAAIPEMVDYALALAILLLKRGAEIDFIWSDVPFHRSRGGVSIGYRYWCKTAAPYRFLAVRPDFRTFQLEQITPAPITPEMQEIVATHAKMDVSYLLLRENIDLENNPVDRHEYEFRLQRNLAAVSRIAAFLDKTQVDRIVMMNGAMLEFGPIYDLADSRGVPVSTYETWTKGILPVSKGRPVLTLDLDSLWEEDFPHTVDAGRRERIEQLMVARQNHPSSQTTAANPHWAPMTVADKTRELVGLSAEKPLVLVCPNVPFDTVFYLAPQKAFPTMTEWLRAVVGYFWEKTDYQIVIRSHPAEPLYATEETVSNLLARFFPALPAHIYLIPAKAEVSTYSLMDVADLGLVYASTTGLEMAMRSIPVVCGMKVHYNARGFTFDAETPEHYFEMAESVLGDPRAYRLSLRQTQLAWSYADLFWHRFLRPFPWRMGPQFWRDLADYPMAQMLSADGDIKYGETIDVLAG
jgi:hypothetical protein